MMRSLPPAGHPIRFINLLEAFLRDERGDCRFRDSITDSPCYFVCSGSAALTLSLLGLREISHKREVLIPAYTCPSVIASVIKAGLDPVLCDLTQYRFEMNLEHLARKMGPNTLGVIAVHLFGIPEKIQFLRSLTKEKEVFLIEDAAQSFGNRTLADESSEITGCSSTQNKRKLGSFGDVSILSFGRGKPLTLLNGGMVIVNNRELLEVFQKANESLPEKNTWAFFPRYVMSLLLYSAFYNPRLYWIPQCIPWLKLGETVFTLDYEVTKVSTKVLDLGSILMRSFREIRDTRIRLTRIYTEKLREFEREFEFVPEYDEDIALLRFPVILKNRERRDKILKESKRKGLGVTGSYPVPLNELKGVSPYLKTKTPYPISKHISERILTLPLHQYVSERDVEDITTSIGNC